MRGIHHIPRRSQILTGAAAFVLTAAMAATANPTPQVDSFEKLGMAGGNDILGISVSDPMLDGATVEIHWGTDPNNVVAVASVQLTLGMNQVFITDQGPGWYSLIGAVGGTAIDDDGME